MKPHIPAGYESCPRCGGMLPVRMTRFHICKGSDLALRPANIPLEEWDPLRPLWSYANHGHKQAVAQAKEPVEAPAEVEHQQEDLSIRLIGVVVLIFLLGIAIGKSLQ